MSHGSTIRTVLALAALFVCLPAAAQWSAQPGDTVRNAFGPPSGGASTVCRGACGGGCPSSCQEKTTFECTGGDLLRRVRTYQCGTHQGCREHDDCLDRCLQQQAQGFDCQSQCHGEAVESYGFEQATSWATGGGSYDGAPITFEYTRDSPDAPEPAFTCPDDVTLRCSGDAGSCIDGQGSSVAPIFDSYSGTGPAAMHISGLRTGPLCGDRVCGQDPDIEVTGEDLCDGGGGAASCTRFAMEFDYRNADPSAPLECSTSTDSGEGDFIGNIIKKGFDSMPDLAAGSSGEGGNGLGQLLGAIQKVVASADSPEDVDVSIAPLGPDGRPIESQRVGTQPRSGPRPIPSTVDLPASSGHLVVPMYQLTDRSSTAPVITREVRCTHKGVPVLETTVRLHFSGRSARSGGSRR